MVCDIIRAGCRERGMVEQGRDWLARSLCSDVSRKALWEARWGVRAEQVGNEYLYIYIFRFHSHLDNQGLMEGEYRGSVHL